MKKEILFLLFILAYVRTHQQRECRHKRARLLCLNNCGGKTLAKRRCPEGKQCCLVKRRSLYKTVNDPLYENNQDKFSLENPWTSGDSNGLVTINLNGPLKQNGQTWYALGEQKPPKRSVSIVQHYFSSETNEGSNVRPTARPLSVISNEEDSSSTLPDESMSSLLDGNVKEVNLELTNGLNDQKPVNRFATHVHRSSPRASVLNSTTMKPLQTKTNRNLRKSAKYCEEFLKIVKRSVEAVPLLPSSRAYSVPVDECSPNFSPLIVGGKFADKAEFPHMAALGFKRGSEIDYLCGGSLISKNFVLSAAHCVKTRWGSPVIVHLGSSQLYSDHATTVGVERVIIHPKYDSVSCYNDIALVKLAVTLNFTETLRPACLPSVRTPAQVPGAITLATGWGKQGFGRESGIDLMKVSLKIIDNHECEKHYKVESKVQVLKRGIIPGMMCAAGYKSTTQDTCQGDSGGPLQSLKEGSKCMMEIIGITSFGKSCGSGIPAVYTRVATYLEWIEDIVWP